MIYEIRLAEKRRFVALQRREAPIDVEPVPTQESEQIH
jgi:hypothetical protein